MKKLLCLILCAGLITFAGCNSFELSGIAKFSETDCNFGLNDGLLPGDRAFLTNYPYENGDYHYWRNEWGWVQAKTYVQLQYSEEVYQQAKLACTESFIFSEEQYSYDTLTFHVVNFPGGDLSLDTAFPGVRLIGYHDDLCTLVFLAYLDDTPEKEQLTASNFVSFLDDQFGAWMKAW